MRRSRRHYLGQRSPLGETLVRYCDFFALFEDFSGDGDTYREYRRLRIELISHRTEPVNVQCGWSFGPTACLAVPVCVS